MFKRLAPFLVFATYALCGQTATHTVTATWTDSQNPTGTTYGVYRATGLCSGTPVFSKLATGLAVKNFVDSTVQPGNFCYAVTATFNSMESAQSNSSAAAIPAFPPSGLSIQVAQFEIQVPGWSELDGGYLGS